MKKKNIIIFACVALINIYFVPLNYDIIKTGGGPFGFSILLLPFLIIPNLLLVSSGLALTEKHEHSKNLMAINLIGLIFGTLLLLLLLNVN